MSSGFKPVYRGTAVQFKEDFSNVREIALHVGGYIITNARGDKKPAVYMPDNRTILHAGQYVMTTEEGVQSKVYGPDFEDSFGKPEDDSIFSAPELETRDFDSYLKTTLVQSEKNTLLGWILGAMDATFFKTARRNRVLNKPLFKRVSEIYAEATGYPMTLEAAKNIFEYSDSTYHKEPNGRFSFLLPDNGSDHYFFYINVDATKEEVQASRNLAYLKANPDLFANYSATPDREEYAWG